MAAWWAVARPAACRVSRTPPASLWRGQAHVRAACGAGAPHRRAGAGTLERRLLAAGLSLATLETGRDQHEAIRLYERCGYTRRGPFAGYPDNGLSVFYEKRLSA
jgi:hypothetical protein